MKRFFFGLVILLSTALLAGCNPLTQYRISEQALNTFLQQHSHFEKQLGVPGVIDAHIVLKQLQSQIGRSEPGKVTLSGHASIDITSLIGSQQAEMQLTLKAQPVFDRTTGAIYLQELELTAYQFQPEKVQTAMTVLIPYLNQALSTYFAQNPVYVLSADNSKTEAIAKKLAQGLEVKPGQLVIPLLD